MIDAANSERSSTPETPRFSVTIPAYNAAATLRETVESVRSQTFEDWECVIVDDGSSDDTLDLARSLAAQDVRIRVFTQKNRGSGGAYNAAVRHAASDLLVMLSADDLLLPEHMAEFDRFITANPEASIYSANGYYEFEDGTREISRLNLAWRDPTTCTMIDLLDACFYGIGATFRREVFDALGGFEEDIYAEDYVFWLHAMARGFRHAYLDRELAVHRRYRLQKSAAGLLMRQTDIRAIESVIATGLLNAQEHEAALRVIKRHKRNVRIRTALARVLGDDLSDHFVGGAGEMRRKAATRRRGGRPA